VLSMLLYDNVDKFVIYDNEKSSSLRLDQVSGMAIDTTQSGFGINILDPKDVVARRG